MRYRVMDRIGSGGMAEVFRATALGPRGFSRTFVIKRILPRLAGSPEFLRMFIDEAKISARLSHPNIVQVFAFAEMDGLPLLVMEHVDGRDLGEMMRTLSARGAPMPPAVAAEIARQCCVALDYAHRLTDSDGSPLGIIHRDVTPSNVMVSWDGTVKLLDFGIARAAQAVRTSQTTAGVMKGKFGYVAPEQLAGGPVDHRADLFAMGAVLHEMLTNRRLFAGETDLGTLKNLMEMAIVPPSRVYPAVGRSLDRIVMRALRRDPGERYTSAAQMAAELEAYLQRARTSGTIVRSFMHGLRTATAGLPPRPVPLEGPGTIILDDVEVLASGGPLAAGVGMGSAPGAIPTMPPVPPLSSSSLSSSLPSSLPPPLPAPPAARAPSAPPRWDEPLERFDWRRLLDNRRLRALAALAAGVALLFFVARGRAPHPRLNAILAPVTGTADRAPVRAAESEVVEITLDSTPQGAQVAREADGTLVAGETPLVLELPRGRAPVSLWLRKDGYEPLIFKVIPNQSHGAMVTLHRAGRPTKTAALDQDTR